MSARHSSVAEGRGRDTREVVDITELNARIAGIVERQAALRTQIDAIVADLEGAQA